MIIYGSLSTCNYHVRLTVRSWPQLGLDLKLDPIENFPCLSLKNLKFHRNFWIILQCSGQKQVQMLGCNNGVFLSCFIFLVAFIGLYFLIEVNATAGQASDTGWWLSKNKNKLVSIEIHVMEEIHVIEEFLKFSSVI